MCPPVGSEAPLRSPIVLEGSLHPQGKGLSPGQAPKVLCGLTTPCLGLGASPFPHPALVWLTCLVAWLRQSPRHWQALSSSLQLTLRWVVIAHFPCAAPVLGTRAWPRARPLVTSVCRAILFASLMFSSHLQDSCQTGLVKSFQKVLTWPLADERLVGSHLLAVWPWAGDSAPSTCFVLSELI